MLITPLDQFMIHLLFNFFSISFTTSLVFVSLISLIFLLLILGLSYSYVIGSSFQYFFEHLYIFLHSLIVEQSTKKGNNFFVFISALFFFILLSNYIGMLPMSFTITSHIFVTLSLGLSIIIGLTIIGFIYQGIYFIKIFIPTGVNIFMMLLLIVIEVVSYMSRGFSLAIRLFANLMSGHTLLNILSSFAFMLVKFNKLLMLLIFFVILAIVLLELALALLQAYVFAVLTCIYLNDSLIGHGEAH